jgi:hypothetical protein
MNTKNISLIGNCQTAALCKFLRKLPNQNECFWLCFEPEWVNGNWAYSIDLWGAEQLLFHIFDYETCIQKLMNSDLVIYQPNFLNNSILSQINNSKILSITLSPIFVNNLSFMTEKEEKYKTNIKVSDIIKQNLDKKLYHKVDNHPTTFLTLEIVKKICEISDMDFFPESIYLDLLSDQYPDY